MFDKFYILLFFLLGALLIGAKNEKSAIEIPVKSEFNMGEVSSERLVLNPNEGIVYFDNLPFTGTSIATYTNGNPSETIEYVNGKRDGYRKKWFEDGNLSYEAQYVSNKLDGTARSWWSNGALRSESFISEGKLNGTQKQWYSSGQLFKELNIVNGKEQGLQRALRENGKIYINYEAKNGRIFGLKRSSLCYELNEEKIVFNE